VDLLHFLTLLRKIQGIQKAYTIAEITLSHHGRYNVDLNNVFRAAIFSDVVQQLFRTHNFKRWKF